MLKRLWRSKTIRKSTQQPSYHAQINQKSPLVMKTQHLPNQIYCKIIELQMQIDQGNLNQNLLIQLLQLYTEAVQFYEGIQDERYKMFQKKLQNFLHKDCIRAVLKGQQNQGMIILKKEKVQQNIKKAGFNNKAQAKRLILKSQNQAQRQKKNIQNQVNKQILTLQRRLQNKRSNSLSNKNKMMSNKLILKKQNLIKNRNDQLKLKTQGQLNSQQRTNLRI